MPLEGGGPTFWESTGTFGPAGLQCWWGVKGGHRAPCSAGHGGSRVWSFRFESLFARAVHWRGGVYWSLHTLVWHLEGQHSEGERPGKDRKELDQPGALTLVLAKLSQDRNPNPSIWFSQPSHSQDPVELHGASRLEAALEPDSLGSNPDSVTYLSDLGEVFQHLSIPQL